jgi:HAD superfamily hydrolase (TIGR01549 family)
MVTVAIQTIIFDLGKVIIPFDFGRGYAAMQPHCPFPAADIPARIGTTDLVIRLESGLIEPRDFYAELRKLLELEIEYEQFCGIWSSIFLPETLIPESMVEALRKRYRMIVLSNTNEIHFDVVRKNYPIIQHFDHLVLSHEVQAMKPDPRIYAAALKHAGCPPENCFFTDDIPAYVEGARRAGINAEQFLGLEKLERDLKAHGVSW